MSHKTSMSTSSRSGHGKFRAALAALAVATLLGGSLPAMAGPAAALVDQEYAAAVQSFRAGRTSMAFGQFMEMANRGDVDSARVALFLHNYGPVLYGKQWDVLPKDLAYWDSLVRNSGTSARAMPEFPVTVLQPTKVRNAAPVTKGGVRTVATAN